MIDWYSFVRFRILENFEGALKRDNKSASPDGRTK